MNQLVEVKRVDLAGVKPYEPLPDMSEQQAELLLVIAPDQLACRSALGSIVNPLVAFNPVASFTPMDTTFSPNA